MVYSLKVDSPERGGKQSIHYNLGLLALSYNQLIYLDITESSIFLKNFLFFN